MTTLPHPDNLCPRCATAAPHPDDIAVDRFADAMKEKLAKKRAQGYGGWDDPDGCSVERLAGMLVDHLPKGDTVDIGNFAMMLWNRLGGDRALAKMAAGGWQPPNPDAESAAIYAIAEGDFTEEEFQP